MKIVNLIENTEGCSGCASEHGLSFYIETVKHKLLVDTGATDTFIRNAEILGVDLAAVDTVILSHGHYDHGGGLPAFVKINSNARIYIRTTAFGNFYHKGHKNERYIGISPEIQNYSQVILAEGNLKIDEELFLLTNVTGRRLWPSGNNFLKCRKGEDYIQDDFSHEQYLVICCEGREVLVSGCAHNGILNILDAYRELRKREPDVVISGFHMMQHHGYSEENLTVIRETAEELKNCRTRFYTGHCTDQIPFETMKEVMGDQLIYVHSGDIIEF